MICFEVLRNGERVAIAGIDAEHVLHAILTSVDVTDPGPKRRAGIDLSVGGLNAETKQHVRWAHVALEVSDTVEVRILDLATSDPPTEARKDPTRTVLGKIRARRKVILRELEDLNRITPTGSHSG